MASKAKSAVDQVKKAKTAQKAVSKGTRAKKAVKRRTSVHFFRPKTLTLPRTPKYPRKSVPARNKFDKYAIVKSPLTTETAMKKAEDSNTLTFLVDVRANKKQIAEAVKGMYDIKAAKVNTLVRPDGQKKAYIRLVPDQEALDIASKIGMI
jgi:large subunit ribosomal protein L23Ae